MLWGSKFDLYFVHPSKFDWGNIKGDIMAYYATRTQQVTDTITEHQLLKFYTRKDRAAYAEHRTITNIKAVDAYKLCLADVWRTYNCRDAGVVFHVARYIP